MLDAAADEHRILAEGRRLLADLADDAWLSDGHVAPHPERHRQYLLHRDPFGRF